MESASLGAVGQVLGPTVWGQQFLGWRFTLSRMRTITKVGGHLAADFTGNGLFAAIVRLPSPTGLPSFAPHAIDTAPNAIVHVLIVPTKPSTDLLVSLPSSIELQPGNYGLIFGGADSAVSYYPFAATGTGVMPNNNTDLAGSSYFFGDQFQWTNATGLQNIRFVIVFACAWWNWLKWLGQRFGWCRK